MSLASEKEVDAKLLDYASSYKVTNTEVSSESESNPNEKTEMLTGTTIDDEAMFIEKDKDGNP
jgi:hypothetical protein